MNVVGHQIDKRRMFRKKRLFIQKRPFSKKDLWLALSLWCCIFTAAATEKPVVIASIKPLAMIATAIGGDDVQVETLLPPYRSPHDYALRFSDRKRLLSADLVIWVGPMLEFQLAKMLIVSSARVPAIELAELEGLSWPVIHYDEGDHPSDHNHGGQDPHIWLNPDNAVLMARAIAAKLVDVAPELAGKIETNLLDFEQNVANIVDISRKRLQSVKNDGFVVVHDGFRHWVDYFQLNQLAALYSGSGVGSGLKGRVQLLAKKGEIDCVFAEPQWPLSKVESVARKLDAGSGVLDPLGQNIVLDSNSYIRLLEQLADNLIRCLAARQSPPE